MKELNPFFILNNKTFREIIFFEKNKLLIILFLSMFSTAIFTTFPLITQFYIRFLYFNSDFFEIMFFTGFFIIVYIFKLLIDIKVEKFEIKFFLNIEKKIKETLIKKNSKNIKELLNDKKQLFTKHLGLFVLLTKTVYKNVLEVTKIFFIGIIIFFFDITLFFYFIFSIPFFFLFYFLIKINLLQKKAAKKNKFEPDFAILLNKLIGLKKEEDVVSEGVFNLEQELEKKSFTRTSHIWVNQLINSFINFYRVFYLAYFGVMILTANITIANLIVGLLFITMLLRSVSSLLKSVPFYSICSESFFKITSLMRNKL